jgi:hypothetical protein
MRLTTPEAPIDLLAVLPELADLRATTIRLHPRKGRVPGRYASKMGGTFLWPSEEPWPTCDEAWPPSWTPAMVDGVPIPEGDPRAAPFPLVPVLQLRADDFPEMPFPPWADLFQLLWCPLGHNYAFMPKPFVFWRNSGEVRRPRRRMPEPDLVAIEMEPGFLPEPRTIHPERIVEFPPMAMWPKDSAEEMYRRLEVACQKAGFRTEHDETRCIYNAYLSVCPANKVGGYVYWVQFEGTPTCECGRRMEHLLTFSDSEIPRLGQPEAEERRWMPRRDWGRVDSRERTGVGFLSGMLYVFICRTCPDWPIRAVSQR